MFCLYLVAQLIEVLGPWSMVSEVRKGEQIAKIFETDGYVAGR